MDQTVHLQPSVSVVVPTRARREMLRICIESLLSQDYPRDLYEVIVVEDGTSDGSGVVEELTAKSSVPLTYLQIPHSGAATARNVGLAHSNADIVAFIDDDAQATREWITELVRPLLEEGVAGSGGRVSPEYPDQLLRAQVSSDGDVKWSGFNVVIPKPQEVDFVAGGNMAFWRKYLVEVEGLDAGFTRRGSWREDTDLHIRLRKKGYRHIYNWQAQIGHRAARWLNPVERLRPGLVWAMTRDDAYFRTKNFGWAGAAGAMRANVVDMKSRIVYGAANFALIFVHMFAWIPGVWQGLRKKNRGLGTLFNR